MASRITGRTKILFILGDPVEHIRGTAMLNDFFAGQGVDAAVSPLHVKPRDLKDALALIRKLDNVVGFGVTIPHKIAVLDLLDGVGARGRLIGAINFVRREGDGKLHGDNVDGLGFVDGLRHNGIEPHGMTALVSGAGGAGRAIAFGLAEAGVRTLRITNRTADRARDLAKAVSAAYPACEVLAANDDPSGCDLVVNATSLGMAAGDAPPVDVDRLDPRMIVAEAVMVPEMTALLTAAAQRGCAIVKGRDMLQAQMQAARELVGL
jgi:shikimate dehydrogenase